MSWVQEIDEATARLAVKFVRESVISLSRFCVVGDYVRYDDAVRQRLKDLKQKITAGIQAERRGQENYLIWGPQGSGKSHFVRQLAKLFGASIRYIELNLADLKEEDFRKALAGIEHADRPVLCLVDEIDSKLAEQWSCEALLPYLEPKESRKRRACFVLVGSRGSDIVGMKSIISLRQKGKDLLSRIPYRNEFMIPVLGIEDKVIVALSNLLAATRELRTRLHEVDKLALLYIALNPNLCEARKIGQLAAAASDRIPTGEDRFRYDYLFEDGSTEKMKFWERWQNEDLFNKFVIVENIQLQEQIGEIDRLDNPLEEGEMVFGEPSDERALICQIDSSEPPSSALETLYRVARDSNFMQNRMLDFKAKRDRILHYEKQKTDQKIRNLAAKLVSQTVTFITGPPAVGKSTFMLFFLESCLTQNIGSWRRIFFINPFEDCLDRTLESGLIQKSLGKDDLAPDDALLVVDGLYRGEPQEVDKAFRLFREVREKGYRLLFTIRSHELGELKEELGYKWAILEGDMQAEPLEPDKQIVRPVITNLLKERKSKFPRFKDINDQELAAFLVSKEYDAIVKTISDKSDGLVGYLTYLMDDLSNIGEFSEEAILRYPKGLASLIQDILERVFLIHNDEVLPTLVLLLAENNVPLSHELMEWFVKWGVTKIDQADPHDSPILVSSILSRLTSLLRNFAIQTTENRIPVYRLNAHWKHAIREFSSTSTEWITRKGRLKSHLNHFSSGIQTMLTRGELVPTAGDKEFVVIADVIQLSRRDEIMKLAKEFLKQYVPSGTPRTSQSSFLTQKLVAILIRHAQKSISQQQDCEKALRSIEDGIEIDSENADLNYRASRYHRLLAEIDPQAIEHCKKALAKTPENFLYNEEMGHVLRLKGEILWAQRNKTMAVAALEESIQYYKHSLRIIERINHIEKVAKRVQENRLLWHVGRCARRVAVINAASQGRHEKTDAVETMLEKAKTCELQGDYNEALTILEKAKSVSLEVDNDVEKLANGFDAIRKAYLRCGTCYEKTDSFSKAAMNYLIYSDLNQYSSDPVETYIEIGDKLVEWKFPAIAHHVLHRVFRRDARNPHILAKMAYAEVKLGRIDFALDNARKALQMSSSEASLQRSIADLIDLCERKLKIRDGINQKILRIISLAASSEEARKLSDEWYSVAMALDDINPRDIAFPDDVNNQERLDRIIDEVKEAKVLCLWRSWRVDQSNSDAKYEAENLTGKRHKAIEDECEAKLWDFINRQRNDPHMSASDSFASPVTEILLHTCFRAIGTARLEYRRVRKKLTDLEIETLTKQYSRLWGWLGARIRSTWTDRTACLLKIGPSVAIKCFELSLRFNSGNRASSNGYAWALFNARRYEEALDAFDSDMKAWDPSNPKGNPAAKTGMAMVYMKKGEFRPTLQNLAEGARLNYEFRYEKPPEKVLIQLTQTVESLKEAACVFADCQRQILKEALRVYEMIKRILNEIEVQPDQLKELYEQLYADNPYLLFLTSLSLRDYLPQEYASVTEEERISTPPEIDMETPVRKTEFKPPDATQVEPKDLEMLPDRPFTNLDQLEELIKGLKGSVRLLDKDLGVDALKFLHHIDSSAVKEIFILGGRSHFGTDLKERCKAFKEEMRNKGIAVEIRVLDIKDCQEIHDRYLISDNTVYNTPPWNIIHKKLGDIKFIRNDLSKRSFFHKCWNRATDISKITT